MAPVQVEDDDPWRAVTRGTLEALRTQAPSLADTNALLRNPAGAVEVREAGAGSGIAELLSRSIAHEPLRADLWLMRFEVYRAEGLKEEFLRRSSEAIANPALSARLDWAAVLRMWDALAPGEPLPGAPQVVAKVEEGPARRRFADQAAQLAAAPLAQLARAYSELRARPGFIRDWSAATFKPLRRPTALEPCTLFAPPAHAPQRGVFLKREDRRNVPPDFENAVAQVHLARALGRSKIVSGNDLDAHAIALATVASGQGLGCTLFLAPEDLDGKPALVEQLTRSGAKLLTGESGADPRLAALRHWAAAPYKAHLALSLGTGPQPYATMASDFQSLLGRETDAQYRALGRSAPRVLVAPLHGRADAIGFILPYLPHAAFTLVIVEPPSAPPPSGARAWRDRAREHRWLRATGRVRYVTIADAQAHAVRERAAAHELDLSVEGARALACAEELYAAADSAADVCVLVS